MALPPNRTDVGPVRRDTPADQVEFRHTEQNTDGSTTRQDRVYRYTGLDVTPTFDVAAEFDEIVRIIAHDFPEGVTATLQAVYGRASGDVFTDVALKGLPVEIGAEHTTITVPLTGRYRFLFKGGWENAPDARVSVVRQQRNAVWEPDGAPVWEPTGEVECRVVDGEEGLWRQERDQHGRLRWVPTGGDCGWQETGQTRCHNGQWEGQEVNLAGDLRWVVLGPLVWTETGEQRCGAEGGNVERQERNQCGQMRWTVVGPVAWTDTGQTRCFNGQYQAEQTNQCGATRWEDRGTLVWTDTGARRCTPLGHEQQESNQCGAIRWTLIGPIEWTDTGQMRCVGDQHQAEQVNQCGETQWVNQGAVVWTDTGQTRCTGTTLEAEQRNPCGETRWVEAGTCYDPTYPLPCGGWAFGPGDIRDPAATVELTDCVEGVGQGIWVYPTPEPGRTVPVRDCALDPYCLDPDDIHGYASNTTITGVRNLCYDRGPCEAGNQ